MTGRGATGSSMARVIQWLVCGIVVYLGGIGLFVFMLLLGVSAYLAGAVIVGLLAVSILLCGGLESGRRWLKQSRHSSTDTHTENERHPMGDLPNVPHDIVTFSRRNVK